MNKYLSVLQSTIKRNAVVISKKSHNHRFYSFDDLEYINYAVSRINILKSKPASQRDDGSIRYWQNEIDVRKAYYQKRKKELKTLAHNQKVLKDLYRDLVFSLKG